MAIVLTAVVVLAWQVAAGGPLDPTTLARTITSPIVVLLPPALAFLAALVVTAALPPFLRLLSRRSARAPLPVRLSLLSISREPGRPAATLTLLAFSLGAIVFATGWSASLQQGIDDAAAYRSGLDLRVTELGTGLSISPLRRAGRPLRVARTGRPGGPRLPRCQHVPAGRPRRDPRHRP